MGLLQETAVETVLYPDPLPIGATMWEKQAAIWDEYIANYRTHMLSGLRAFGTDDPWSIREAVGAAWDIESSTVGFPTEIGP